MLMSYYRIRAERLRDAKSKGRHTLQQWMDMLDFFEHTCCACLGENGGHIQKDHIVSLYAGGSDHIRNLQPLCNHCNASKSPDFASDWRPQLADFLGKQLPELYTNPF